MYITGDLKANLRFSWTILQLVGAFFFKIKTNPGGSPSWVSERHFVNGSDYNEKHYNFWWLVIVEGKSWRGVDVIEILVVIGNPPRKFKSGLSRFYFLYSFGLQNFKIYRRRSEITLYLELVKIHWSRLVKVKWNRKA